jgi:hypothetical protein
MHLCIQGDHIDRKVMGHAPADMARLSHLINTKKSVSWGYTYFELALL